MNAPPPSGDRPLRVALLVSPDSFEAFYEDMLGLDEERFVEEYRNDFAWQYAAALDEHGIEVLIYVPSRRLTGLQVAGDGRRVRFVPMRGRPAAAWAAVIRRAVTPVERYLGESAHARLMLPGLRRGIAEDGVEALYVQEYWTGRFDTLVRALTIPVVAGEHGGSEGRQLAVRKRGSLTRAAAITCQSRAEQSRLRRLGVEAVLIPNSVDEVYFSPGQQSEPRDRTVLTVARLVDAQKRVSVLIDALALLPPPWRLSVVGTGPDESELRERAQQAGLGTRVDFTGFVMDKHELRRRYRDCAVFALPSRWEAMTIAVLEAMSCGAPPVVTPLRPFLDLVRHGENGMLVPHDDPQRLASAIEEVYSRRTELGAAARSTIEEGYARGQVMSRLAELLHAAGRSPAEGASRFVVGSDAEGGATITTRHDADGKLDRLRAVGPVRRLLEFAPVRRAASLRRLVRHLRPVPRFLLNELFGRSRVAVYRLRDSEVQVLIRHGTWDVWTFNEVFELGLYDPPPAVESWLRDRPRPLLVVDLGANIGLYGAMVQAREPAVSVVGFEPDPENTRIHRRCIELNDAGDRWKLVPAAAAREDGSVAFAAEGDITSHIATEGSATSTVPARDVFAFLHRVDLLKMDIEGGEWELLGDDRFGEPAAVVMEYHPHLCPADDPHAEVERLLRGAGYTALQAIYKAPDGHGMLWAWKP